MAFMEFMVPRREYYLHPNAKINKKYIICKINLKKKTKSLQIQK